MAQHKIAFDESGNTGANLLDAAQPVFTLASVNVSVEEAADIVRTTSRNSDEMHFVKLRRSARGRSRIMAVLRSDVLCPDRCRLSAYHKPFMITTKIVDLLIEPMAHEDGMDLYERGANIAMSNMWHTVAPVFIGEDRFRELQSLFVNFVCQQTWRSVMKFYRYVDRLFGEFEGHKFQREIGLLLAATQRIGWKHYAHLGDSYLDPAFPAFFDLGCYWSGMLGEVFDIVHDSSHIIEKEQDRLELLMSPDLPTEVIGYDRRKQAFPIKATGIQFVDSALHPQVQVADIVAGAAAYALKKVALAQVDQFARDILESPLFVDGDHNVVWPSKIVSPAELGTDEVGGIDAVAHITDFIEKRKAKARAK